MHAKSEDSASDDKMAIIDAHLHTKFSGNPNRFSKITDSRESLTKEMADNHVVGAIAHAYSDGRGWWDLKDQHVIHCAGLDKTVNVKQLDADLKSKKYRCIKVYLGYIPQYATDPHYEPAYKLAEKYNVPVVFHTGDTSDRKAWVKYSEPMAIDEVAVKYPKVKFVIAHLGNPWVETAAELVYKNENVYADISAFLVGDLSRRTPEDIEEYVVKPIRWAFHFVEDNSKLMYGTDWPLADMKSYIWAVKRAIPRDHWKDVFYNNAQAVFKIPGLPEKE
jgi:predicted TIM-barrel fold metal-dependent hydrolase